MAAFVVGGRFWLPLASVAAFCAGRCVVCRFLRLVAVLGLPVVGLPGVNAFIGPRPNGPWMTWQRVMLTQLRPGFKAGRDVFPLHSGTYDHNVWSRTGLSGAGHFAQGFGASKVG